MEMSHSRYSLAFEVCRVLWNVYLILSQTICTITLCTYLLVPSLRAMRHSLPSHSQLPPYACPTLGSSSSRLPDFCWPVLFPHSQSETESAYTSYGRESSVIILEPIFHPYIYSISTNYWKPGLPRSLQFLRLPDLGVLILRYTRSHSVARWLHQRLFALPRHTPLLTHRISAK